MDGLLVYGMITLIGLVFSGAGVWLLLHAKREQARCSVEAAGRVADYAIRKKTGRHHGTFCYPIIEYCVDGQPVRGKSLDGSTRKKHEIGDEVSLHYNPEKPTEMILPGRKSLIPFAWLYIFSGILAIVLTYTLVPFLMSLGTLQ